MGYQLIITEKPTSSEKIASALADKKAEKIKDGKVSYYHLVHKGKEIYVVCAVGHLFTVVESEKKGWKYPTFDIKWVASSEAGKESGYTKPYLNVIKKLALKASEFVVACDWDIEGEVIGERILHFICRKEDALRMHYSTTTSEDLLNSYEHISPHIDRGLADAGITRHELDYLYGINLSRALTLSVRAATGMFKILSSGRVQGPALKLLYDKEIEIGAFVPVAYSEIELHGETAKDKVEILAYHKEDRFFDKKKAEQAFNSARKAKDAKVISLDKREVKQSPPLPFDLTTLQMEAYAVLGLTPKVTLEAAQNLYTNSYISYPRTSSQKLPPSIDYKKILKKLGGKFSEQCGFLLGKSVLKPTEGKKEDPAHPAIYPTGELPKKLQDREVGLYELIVHRFFAVFGEDAIRETATLTLDANSELFIAKGTRTIFQGWHKLYGRFLKLEEEELPKLSVGDSVFIKDLKLLDKFTQPPKRYTEASIIRELEKRNLGTKSIAGNTLIYVNGNWIPISTLFENGAKCDNELLMVLPSASFYNLSLKKCSLKNNILVAKRQKLINEKIYSIETNFTNLVLDTKHKCFVVDNNNNFFDKPAAKISIQDKLLFTRLEHYGKELITYDWLNSISRKYKLQKKDNKLFYQNGAGFSLDSLPIVESNKLFWLLGYIYGDGSTCKRQDYIGYNISITIDKNELFLINKLTKTIEDLFGLTCFGITYPSNRNTIRIDIPSVISFYLVKRFPYILSKCVFDVPKDFIGDFIKGYMDSDGNIHLRGQKKAVIKGVPCNSNNTPRIKFVLSRENHVIWIKDMLNLLNIKTTPIVKKIAKIGDKCYNCYELKISGKNNILIYAFKVGFEHPKKRELLYKGLFSNSKQYLPIKKLIQSLQIILKNDNQFVKFEDKLTYTLLKYSKLGLIERKRINLKGKSRKYSVRIFPQRLDNVFNFLLGLFGKEILPWNYSVDVSNVKIIDFNEEYLYDLIVDKENPTFIINGGQIIHNSTRASIIDNLYQRNYIVEKAIQVTNLGKKTVETLVKYCPEILDEALTRKFEEEMDAIQEKKIKGSEIINEAESLLTKVLAKFKKNEKTIGKELAEATIETRDKENYIGKCPNCLEGKLETRRGRFGIFAACSNYPECKTTATLPKSGKVKATSKICEICKFPIIQVLRARKGMQELCINVNCPKKAIPAEIANMEKHCPKCNSKLVLRKGLFGAFWACPGFPKCRYLEGIRLDAEGKLILPKIKKEVVAEEKIFSEEKIVEEKAVSEKAVKEKKIKAVKVKKVSKKTKK